MNDKQAAEQALAKIRAEFGYTAPELRPHRLMGYLSRYGMDLWTLIQALPEDERRDIGADKIRYT